MSSTLWIGSAPATLLIDGGRSRSGMFSFNLDLSHELHQVDGGLAQSFAVADDRLRWRGADAIRRIDRAGAIPKASKDHNPLQMKSAGN
ncbi:MAG TPA: hypothetical protein VMG60_18120 [Burkholderiaceae bacterium]|nr:hypothetical protein [Burkholderiaceae bacterium]